MLLGGRRDEQSAFQAKDIELTSTDSVMTTFDEIDALSSRAKCRNCGGSFPHKGPCPAKGKQCRSCGKLNHFQSVCRSRPIAQQPSDIPTQQDSTPLRHGNRNSIRPLEHQTTSDSDEDYVYGVSTSENSPRVKVTVCRHSSTTLVDTGATINVIDEHTYKTLRGIPLQRTTTKAFAYNFTTPVPFLGKFTAPVETRRRITAATFYVAEGSQSGNLLSLSTT